MQSSPSNISASEGKAAVKEARALLRRGRKSVGSDVQKRVLEAVENVEKSVPNTPEFQKNVVALQQEVDRSLAFARKSKTREYVESISFAVLIALAIRSFIFEPYKIPSPSMVPTLLVGDRLYVSKFTYGIRLPLSTRYLVSWKKPQVGDIVVFQFPRHEAQTRDTMGQWIQRLEFVDGQMPATLQELRDARTGQALTAAMLKDAWGRPLVYERSEDGYGYSLASAGPDGTVGTADDITREQVAASLVAFPDSRRPSGQTLVHRCPIDQGSLTGAKTYIKRIVGLPGDTIELRNNALYLNGAEVARTGPTVGDTSSYRGGRLPASMYRETLPNGGPSYTTRVLFDDENFGPVTVPEGHFFGMGDNRDESSDSRCWGFVPLGNIKGHAKFVLFSVKDGGGFVSGRSFSGLE